MAHGLDWRQTGRNERVIVERASVYVDAGQIESALKRELAGRNLDVELENRSQGFHMPSDKAIDLDIENLTIDGAGRRLTASVTASGAGTTLRVAARLHALTDLPVLKEPVMPGEIIKEAQVAWTKVRVDRVHTSVATDTRHIVGQMPRRPLRPGEPVAIRDLQPKLLVTKGALVTLRLQTPFMTLTTQGRALDDGAQGTVIRVANLQTKTTVEGTVSGPDMVVVMPTGMALAQTGGK
jgi:flagellar basal body P-ring formation protein FlgA